MLFSAVDLRAASVHFARRKLADLVILDKSSLKVESRWR